MRLGSAADYQTPPENQRPQSDGAGPVIAGCSLLALLAALSFALVSLAAVPPLSNGILYNGFSKAADTSTIYAPGRYFICPWNKFLLFPSNVQTIEFANVQRLQAMGIRYAPLHTRTSEGLALHLQISLQYRLPSETLGKLYMEFNQNYEQVYISTVRDVLIKAASEYEADDLWEDRAKFGSKMQAMADKALRKTYAECWGLQLLMIDLPSGFESSIVSTQVRKQTVRTQEMDKASARVRAHTDVIKAEYDRQAKVIMAEGNANYSFITKQAEAQAQRQRIDTEAEVLGAVKAELHLGGAELVLYQKYGALDELVDATVYSGFDSSSRLSMQIRVETGGN